MESPTPAPVRDESTVKKEEPVTSNDVQMTDAPDLKAAVEAPAETTTEPEPQKTEIAPASIGSLATINGITKNGYAVMDEVVHKLTAYRTQEYVN